MRNRHQAVGIAVMFLIGMLFTPLYAAQEGTKSGRTRRDVSVHPVGAVHHMGDWIATRHMPKEERRMAIEKRRAERQVRQAEEEKKREQRRMAKKTILDADKKSR